MLKDKINEDDKRNKTHAAMVNPIHNLIDNIILDYELHNTLVVSNFDLRRIKDWTSLLRST